MITSSFPLPPLFLLRLPFSLYCSHFHHVTIVTISLLSVIGSNLLFRTLSLILVFCSLLKPFSPSSSQSLPLLHVSLHPRRDVSRTETTKHGSSPSSSVFHRGYSLCCLASIICRQSAFPPRARSSPISVIIHLRSPTCS